MGDIKRRQWIIDRDLQLRFVGVLLCLGLLNFIFYILILHYFLGELRGLYEAALTAQGISLSGVDFQRGIFYKAAFFGGLLQALLMLWLGVYFSNKISGPVYRLNSVLKQLLAGGDVTPVKLRKHDFMVELSENFNKTLVYYHNFRGELLKELQSFAEAQKGSPAVTRLTQLLEKLKRPPQDDISA